MLSSGLVRRQLGFSGGLLTGLVGCCMVACHLLNMLLAKRLPCCCKSDLRASQVGSPLFSCCGSLQAKGAALSTQKCSSANHGAAQPSRMLCGASIEGSTTISAHSTGILQQAPGRCTQPMVCLQQVLQQTCAAMGNLTRAWPFGLRWLHLDPRGDCLPPQLMRACCHQPLALLPCCAGSQVPMSEPHQQLPGTPPAGAVHVWHQLVTARAACPMDCGRQPTHLHDRATQKMLRSCQQGAHPCLALSTGQIPKCVSWPIPILNPRPKQATY